MSKVAIDDEKDSQAFLELRQKYEETRSIHQAVLSQQQATAGRQRRGVIMTQEIGALPDDTRIYKSVGKAYFLSDKPKILSDLEAAMASTEEEMKQLAAKREHTEKTIQETEREITELVSNIASTKVSSS